MLALVTPSTPQGALAFTQRYSLSWQLGKGNPSTNREYQRCPFSTLTLRSEDAYGQVPAKPLTTSSCRVQVANRLHRHPSLQCYLSGAIIGVLSGHLLQVPREQLLCTKSENSKRYQWKYLPRWKICNHHNSPSDTC